MYFLSTQIFGGFISSIEKVLEVHFAVKYLNLVKKAVHFW